MLYPKYYFYVVILLAAFSAHGTCKINDIDINTMTKAGEWFSYPNIHAQAIELKIIDNNIELREMAFNDPEEINQSFYNLNKNLMQMSSGGFSIMSAGGEISLRNRLSEAKGIFYKARAIEIERSVLKARSVSLMGKTIKLCDCYTLELESNNPASMVQVIRFVFDLSSAIPHITEGTINFDNITTANLLVAGVKRIEFLFRPNAF